MTLIARSDWTDCPDAEVCKTCPCAAEDDVCMPIERVAAEVEPLRQQLKEAVDALQQIKRGREQRDGQMHYFSGGEMQFIARHALARLRGSRR